RSMPSMVHESDSRRSFPSAVGSAGHDEPDSVRERSGMASATAVGLHLPFLRLRRIVFRAERNPESSLVAGTGSHHSIGRATFGSIPRFRVGPMAGYSQTVSLIRDRWSRERAAQRGLIEVTQDVEASREPRR